MLAGTINSLSCLSGFVLFVGWIFSPDTKLIYIFTTTPRSNFTKYMQIIRSAQSLPHANAIWFRWRRKPLLLFIECTTINNMRGYVCARDLQKIDHTSNCPQVVFWIPLWIEYFGTKIWYKWFSSFVHAIRMNQWAFCSIQKKKRARQEIKFLVKTKIE